MRVNLRTGFQIIKRCLHTNDGSKVGILGVPFEKKGQAKKGVGNGPRDLGLVERLEEIEGKLNIKDYGDVSYEIPQDLKSHSVPNMKEYEHITTCNHEVSKSVENILRDSRICVSLGGDHSFGVGTVDGHIKAKDDNVCVLWVDAHADLNTNKTSSTGNVHGMPLALLAKELSHYWPYLPGMDWQEPIISLRNIAYIGLRSVDSYERLVIDKLGLGVPAGVYAIDNNNKM